MTLVLPATEGGPCRGRCLHCCGWEWLETVYPVEDLASAVYYWQVFCAVIALQYPDVFFGHETGTAVARFKECRGPFEEKIRRCVLLAQADGSAH